MQIPPELKTVLKRLKLSGMLATLLDRWAYARQEKLDYPQFLELILSDEVERRDHQRVANRLRDAGYRVLFSRADLLLKTLARSRADKSFDRELRRFISPDLLVVDDFGLKKLSSQATSDFYDLLIERHTRSSTILTSNRGVDEWMAVFDEPLLGQSALDRFCHRAHQFIVEGESYRKRTAPGSASAPKTERKATS